jgi:hypothetical protein
VPTAYETEWEYLKTNTNLWYIWKDSDPEYTAKLARETPDEQVLIQCLGHKQCQRNFRSITCRAFPFFPYITGNDVFIGLAYYWEYEARCWVINYLEYVTQRYVRTFVAAYVELFNQIPNELQNFKSYSSRMRKIFRKQHRRIPLLHCLGGTFLVHPENEELERINPIDLPKFGPYIVAAKMRFPDEI